MNDLGAGKGVPGDRQRRSQHNAEDLALELAAKTQELERLRAALANRSATLDAVLNSRGWRLLNRYRILKNEAYSRLIPPAIQARRLAAEMAGAYEAWIKTTEAAQNQPDYVQLRLKSFRYLPLISVLLPAGNAHAPDLERTVSSIQRQVYPAWELCISSCDHADSPAHKYLEDCARQEGRIKLECLPQSSSRAASWNAALRSATGEFVALLENEGELSPLALLRVAQALQESPEADFLYSDEDCLNENGTRCDPFFKPDWSPEYMLSFMYTGSLAVFRRSEVIAAGAFREALDGAEEYDLALRISEGTEQILHLPYVLYHRRRNAEVVAGQADAQPSPGERALQEHMERRGIQATVSGDGPERYRVRPRIVGNPLISILIPIKDRLSLLKRCLRSIETKTTYSPFEVVVADNGSTEKRTQRYLASLPHRVVPVPGPFNFSRINNLAVKQAHGQYLVFLNNDTEVIAPDWLTAMLEFCQLPEIGAVGAKLLYPNNTIQHAGVVLGIGFGSIAGHCCRWVPRDYPVFNDVISRIRNYSAVTAACCMIRREVFEQVGGFDEELPAAFNDVDLCLRIRAAGYRIVYTPYSVLYHCESRSRGHELDLRDVEAARQRWGDTLIHDPYYNTGLSTGSRGY